MIKTKLVATVGPACDDPDALRRMIGAGVGGFRVNFSHGTLEGHAASLRRIRRAAADAGRWVGVMGDLCGPKVRLGKIHDGECVLAEGSQVVLQREPIDGTATRLSTNYRALIDDVEVDHRVVIDDGSVHLRVIEKRADELVCRCEIGGVVRDHKGVNLPDSKISAATLTAKDRADLAWAFDEDLDFIALSFVRHPDDVRELSRLMDASGCRARVIAKIEKPQAVHHLDEIIRLAGGILVARGDLGVEMELSRVPMLQKEITLRCRRAGKPVIVATQMLQSMVDSPVPTRAEVSDVANAILDGADAIMLSAETAIGRYPVEAVRAMADVAARTEQFAARHTAPDAVNCTVEVSVATAVVRAASMIAADLDPPVVAVWTEAGDTPRLLSKHRIAPVIVALAPNARVCRQSSLLYGVAAIERKQPERMDTMFAELDRLLLEQGWAAQGDQIVVVADSRPDVPGETDVVFIHRVGSSGDGDHSSAM